MQFFMNPYLQRLPKKNRERVVADIQSYIMGESAKDYADRIGIKDSDADVRRGRAHIELIRVCLPDILKRSRTLLVRFGSQIESSKREILDKFFTTGDFGDIKQQKAIAGAYRALWMKASSYYKGEQDRLIMEENRLINKEEKYKKKDNLIV